MFNPKTLFLFFVLSGIVAALLFLSSRPTLRSFFDRLPVPLWCYFIPMALSSAGLLPSSSPLYGFFGTTLLGACLFLLLLGSNPRQIWQAGPAALGATAFGAIGMLVGAVAAYALLAGRLHPEMWKGIASLSASWTGGSANMVAVKEALNTPETVFAPCLVVDPLVTYSWMSLLIALKPLQSRWDRWVGARRDLLNLSVNVSESHGKPVGSAISGVTLALIIVSLLIAQVALSAGRLLPPVGAVLNAKGWAFLLVTVAGILASLSPLTRWGTHGTSWWGNVFLYMLLASLGAQARFQDLFQAPLLLAVAFIMLSFHAIFLLVGARWLRLPFFFVAAASQANIGGTASAPIVAGLYHPSLAPVGLLLALLLNMLGTTLGLCTAQLCRWFSGAL